MGDPWHYCERCATFSPPTEAITVTQRDGEIVALCDACYSEE
jgi:RNase P subunit RPR2